ncbi:MAG: SMP-30/gluconolactonase/LRE family protein [Eubacteriales bacterium]|nr:SMP-30/gluconolactonase/LRE family protein [Eubacteriales bacterium]
MKAELLVKMRAVTGEGPVWDEREGVLYWLDIPTGLVMRWHPDTGENEVRALGGMVGCVALREQGGLVAALQNGVHLLDFDSGALTFLCDPQTARDTRFNDGKCDPRGDFWAGTMSLVGKPGQGALYRIPADGGKPETLISSVSISNGLAWVGDTFYYTDTPTREICAYDYDSATGAIACRRTVVKTAPGEGAPDGFTVDREGRLWVAQWGGSRVCCYDPNTGRKLEEILLPASCVSCCAFGGEAMDELYITTACENFTPAQLEAEPLAGSLFRVKPGAKGLPAGRFAR